MIDGADQRGTELKTDGWRPGTLVRAGSLFEVLPSNWFDGLEHPQYPPQRIYVTGDCEAGADGRMTMPVRELEHLTVNNDLLLGRGRAGRNTA